MEAILQPSQTKKMEETLHQSQTQQDPQKLIVKVPKMSVYIKRSSSEDMDISDQQTTPKNMKFTQYAQIVNLEEEESRYQSNTDMVRVVLAL